MCQQIIESYKILAEMMVWYVLKLRKQKVYFNLISTVSFVALNKERVKMCFICIFRNTKLMQLQFIKSLGFQLG